MTFHHTTEQSEVVAVVVERHQTKLLYLAMMLIYFRGNIIDNTEFGYLFLLNRK